MKTSKRIISVLLAAAMSASCAACSSQESAGNADTASGEGASQAAGSAETSGEQVTITFSLWDEIQSKVYQEIIDKFEEENPDIHVEMQLTPWDQYWTKFDAAAGANQAADTFFMNVNYAKYVEAGILEPLDEWIERDSFDTSVYTPALVELFTYNGQLIAMPKGMDSQAVAYNKAIFEQYGVEEPTDDWTWQDMLDILAQLKEKIGEEDIYPMALALNSINSSWGHIMWQFGGNMFMDNTSVFNSQENIDALSSIVDMIDNGYIPDYTTISDTAAEELYISGKAAMLYLPTFSSQKIEQSSLEDTVLVTLPEAKSKNAMLIGMGYGMNSASEHKEEAWRFLKYLGGDTANEMIGKSGIDIPAMSEYQKYYPESFTKFDGMPFIDQLQYTAAYENAPYYVSDEASTIYTDHMMKIFTKEESVQDGLAAIDSEINALIEENA